MTLNISRQSAVGLNTHSSQQWCPRDVLDLCEYDRCVGYAPSKRRKCQAYIGYRSTTMMDSIIEQISEQPPDPAILRPQLQRLATYGLCVRYHQRQADAIVQKWSSKIYAAFPTGTVPVDNSSPSITSTSVSEISSPVPSRRSSILSDSSEGTTVSSTSDSAESTHQTVTPSNSISQIPRTATPSSADDDATELPASLLSPLQPQPCTGSHARRILLDDPCPICHEGDPLSSCSAADLVWCKSSCGRPLHKSCFEAWRTQRELDGQSPTCVICRADWDDECDCQGCHHVPRRSGETACAICLDALVSSGAASDTEEGTVWCRDGCGKSVHKICFEVWQGHCVDSGRDATCVLCRATWNSGCAC